MMSDIVLTQDLINNFIEGVAGVKHSQLMLLGEYPLKSGWKERLIGKKIALEEYEMLVRSKGQYLNNGKLKKELNDHVRLKKAYLKELIANGL